MKIRRLLLIFSLSSSVFVFSQTKEDVMKITRDYDITKLKKLEQVYKENEATEKKAAYEMAAIKGWPLVIKGENGSIQELMSVTPDGFPLYYATTNVAAAKSTRANFLNTGGGLGLTLDGQGMVARVWDQNTVRRTHSGFGGRVTTVDDPTGTSLYADHGTHVTGTILALPWNVGSAAVKGMASQATARTFNWDYDESESISEALGGMLLSNYSYGVPIGSGSSTLPAWYIGAYSSSARVWDEISYNAPYFLAVKSAGNDGLNNNNPNPILSGYDKLAGDKLAKNSLIIANSVDATIAADGSLTSVSINSSSSQGPTDDRRIKPDITGNGTGLTSTISTSNTATASYSGTSMSSPNVTGTLLLLQQYHKVLTTGFMKAATLKGLACHTADDAGVAGPDPKFGWGLLNAKKAAETVRDNGLTSWVSENSLSQNETFNMTVKSNGGASNPLIASITWTDLPGTANNGTLGDNYAVPVLVNDIDIRVTKDGTTTFYPWKLQSSPSALAVRTGDNNVDNVEVIKIDTPVAGDYVITVTHKGSLVTGKQDYSLVVTGITSNFTIISKSDDVIACDNQNAVYTFDYKQTGVFTTNFSAVGLPSGAIATFSPTSLSANGTVTMTISGLSSVLPGLYTIGITGSNGTETETRYKKLKVYSSTFSPVTLTSPSNGFNGASTSINLVWQSNDNVESYNIQVSTSPTFTTTILDQTVSNANYIVSNLNQDAIYYWRVIPSNRCGIGSTASAVVYSFKTGIVNCGNVFNASDFTNATIATTANATASVPVEVTGGITINSIKVNLDITHTWIGDMIISLKGPASIGSPEITLLNQPCVGSDSTYPNILVTIDEAGPILVCEVDAPIVRGIAKPFESFTSLNGLIADGTWTLEILDVGNGDGGTINAVSLDFCNVSPGTLSSNVNSLSSLRIYPNPAKRVVNIDLAEAFTGDTTFKLFDVQGRQVISKKSSNTIETLNVENLSEGIYMLTIENNQGKTTRKVVVNK